jgi:hypothetical protein
VVVILLDETHRVDVTHEIRSDDDWIFYRGNQDRAASCV